MLELFRSLFAPPRHLILLVLAAWLGLTLAEKRAARRNVTAEALNNLAFYGLLAFVLGGRVSYALAHLSAFSQSPLSLFALNPDLFEALGGSIAAVLAALVYGQRQKLSLWNTLDALTPFFAVLAVGIGLSHLAAGTAFGKPTDLPWAIELWNAKRHPSQIYELLASLLTLGLVWFQRPNPRPGLLFLTFAALSSAARLFLEAFRGDSAMFFNGIRSAQVLAWILLTASFALHEWRERSTLEKEAAITPPGTGYTQDHKK
jgi:phosphatidylglycerol:prolipoprotein diacylglycerol transferase